MPFFSRLRHSTAVERRPVGSPPAFGVFRLQREVPRRLLSETYQSSQRSIPQSVKSGSSTLQKDDLLNCWISTSDISGYHAEFHEGHGNVGARHGHGMLCVNRPLMFSLTAKGPSQPISIIFAVCAIRLTVRWSLHFVACVFFL